MALLKKKAQLKVITKKADKPKEVNKEKKEVRMPSPPEKVVVPFTMKLKSLSGKKEREVIHYEVHIECVVPVKTPAAAKHSYWRRDGRDLIRVPDFMDAAVKGPMYDALAEAWALMKHKIETYKAEVKKIKEAE